MKQDSEIKNLEMWLERPIASVFDVKSKPDWTYLGMENQIADWQSQIDEAYKAQEQVEEQDESLEDEIPSEKPTARSDDGIPSL